MRAAGPQGYISAYPLPRLRAYRRAWRRTCGIHGRRGKYGVFRFGDFRRQHIGRDSFRFRRENGRQIDAFPRGVRRGQRLLDVRVNESDGLFDRLSVTQVFSSLSPYGVFKVWRNIAAKAVPALRKIDTGASFWILPNGVCIFCHKMKKMPSVERRANAAADFWRAPKCDLCTYILPERRKLVTLQRKQSANKTKKQKKRERQNAV